MRKELALDWPSIGFYLVFVLFGWLNLYAATTNDASLHLFDLDQNYGRQFVFILVSAGLGALLILLVSVRDIELLSYPVYLLTVLLLVGVFFLGAEAKGAQSWFKLGSFRLQPSEFAKIGTALALAKYLSTPNVKLTQVQHIVAVAGIIAVPVLLIILQNDTGTALVFVGFIFMLYREGLAGVFLVLVGLVLGFGVMGLTLEATSVLNLALVVSATGYILYRRPRGFWVHLGVMVGLDLLLLGLLADAKIDFVLFGARFTRFGFLVTLNALMGLALAGYIFLFRTRQWLTVVGIVASLLVYIGSVQWVFNNVLLPHQQDRITAIFNPSFDPQGVNYNTNQSKIAIGSGGLFGKGFLEGTQTKFDFVPQQHTDFIFCTVGEEWGWIGSTAVLVLFFFFLVRQTELAEESKSNFARIYGYGVVGMLFMHILVNVGMAIGLAPVIGIPLPFFSYGGSALLSFSLMVFILWRFYAYRQNVLASRLG